ncbi:MAG: glycosyltransferase family 4 protein [Bacteroidaceae bacterium]|nr:glycosyltransferase family 4 protein [Bacteroidaceae bacterium]
MKDSKINVIPHGILQNDVDDVAVLDMQKILQQQLSIKLSDIVFSCLGYQYAYKGVDLVADVWRNTPSLCNNPNAHLLMVGKNRNVDASVFDSIKDIPNVYIMDEQIDDVDFEAYMRISSVVLLPYKEISQSGLLFTAICAGVPTLVSNVGGLEDPLQYAQIGWSIGEPTYDNLLSVMTHLIGSPEEIQQVRENKDAFRLVRSVYSWEKIAEKTSQLYMKLSGKNS